MPDTHVTDLAPPEEYPPQLPPDTRRVVVIEGHMVTELDWRTGEPVAEPWDYTREMVR